MIRLYDRNNEESLIQSRRGELVRDSQNKAVGITLLPKARTWEGSKARERETDRSRQSDYLKLASHKIHRPLPW